MTAPDAARPNASPRLKRQLRAVMVDLRVRRSARETAATGPMFSDQALTVPEVAAGPRVALFVGHGAEPDTQPLIDALHSRGVEILLPVLLDDLDLDWGSYQPESYATGRFGLLVPTTPKLGAMAITTVAAVICPGVAVDRAGNRLGRGGGSYDRALARCGPSIVRCQLAYDDEVVASVPAQPHDQPVDVVITPTTTIRIPRTSRPGAG